MLKKARKKLLVVFLILLVLTAILAALGNFYTEFLWFDHLGFAEVFKTVFWAQVGIGAAFGAVALVVLLVHIWLIKRFSKPREDWSFPTAAGDTIDLKEVMQKVGTPVVLLAALAAAAVMGYWASKHWEDLLKYFNQTPFNLAEPILNKDIGFYLFVLPSMQFVQEWLVYLTGLSLVLSAVVYFLRGAIHVDGKNLEMDLGVQGHLLFGVASIMGVLAWGWRIEMFETLFSKRGVAYGATYTDVHLNLLAYKIMIGACLACAAFMVYLIFTKPRGPKATKHPAYALLGVVVLYALLVYAGAYVMQKFVVDPNELDKEAPYLVHAIAGTRTAYGLDKIESKRFPANDKLSAAALERNKTTIDNIKIWDHRPLKATYKQLQAIRLYYDFPSIGVDRYHIDDRYMQVMLSARELVTSQLPKQSQTWVNQHLKFTHGYGVCLSPVREVGKEGLPQLWIKDIPPVSRFSQMKITRPEIYYGQVTTDYALVRANTPEFDYPKGDDNKYATYAGEGGVGIGSFFRRLLFAIRMGDVNLVFTKSFTEESRILFNRTIQDRVFAVAPFLMADEEPYLTVVDGRLFWIQDAYTISYRYPYSQPSAGSKRKRINYIRNSVKVVLDAYHGKMKLYIWDETDPLIRTYAKIFPSLFEKREAMPAELRKHVRYPKDLFRIQASMYESFHMTDPQVWYNQEDKWDISKELADKTTGRQQEVTATRGVTAKDVSHPTDKMAPYYMIMKLPDEQREEFLVMVPYTPKGKDNMVAWMTGRCDGDNYGKLLVYTFPKQKLIFGPMQIEARIDQDDHISQWITLRNQQGSEVIRGDLLVIPIEDSILYVEPIYLEATQTKLPELRQVIVAFGKRLTMKADLREALYEVFDLKASKPVAAKPKTPPKPTHGTKPIPESPLAAVKDLGGAKKLVDRAMTHYQAAQGKVAKGDWAGYGVEQKRLKRVLDALARSLEAKIKANPPKPQSTPAPQPKPAPAPQPTPAPQPKPAPAQ